MGDTTPDTLATTELLYDSLPNATTPSGNSTYQYVISTSQVSFLVIMAILIIVFNITVLLVHHFTPALKVPMSVFLKSLAYADLWVGVNCALNIGVTYAGGWPYGLVTCKLVGYLLLVVVLVSIMSLTCISLERYAAIQNPLHYRTVVTYTRSRLCVIALWVASGIVFLPAFFNWGKAWDIHGSCTLFWRYNISFGFFVIAIFIMPNLLISATCYIRIIFMLVARQRWLRSGAGTPAERQHERLMAKIGLAVMSAFYVTWLPYVAASFLRFLNLASISPSFYNSALYLGISNSFLNCIIYSISHKAFRDGLKSLVLRFCCCCLSSKRPGRKQSAASTRRTSSNGQSTSAAASSQIDEAENIDLEVQKHKP
ncbi:probable G-protein coupled receptor 21 [Diadema antillarum]|uniref:probable G-protein coupled receptor 21 n=1 Tax=Diadema antillarum TaxID=105358 RepID=UPI003A8A1F2C